MIYWDPPFSRGDLSLRSQSNLERAVWDPGYSGLTLYIAQAREFLKPGGRLLLAWSNFFGDATKLEEIASEHGWVGAYFDSSNTSHGFLRDPDGKMTTFDAPGAVNGTFIASNNAAGAITGFYADSSGNVHGFLRPPDGKVKEFDAPGAIHGTYAVGNNSAGAVTGYYVDSNGASRGFVLIP